MDISQAIEELVPILSIGLHEIVQQVTHQCLERGVVLEKIWRTYVELFERALTEARASLRRHKERASHVEAELAKTRGELANLQDRHPEQIAKLSKTLEGKFSEQRNYSEERLKAMRADNITMETQLKNLQSSTRSWFPLFQKYKDSLLRRQLQRTIPHEPKSDSPEAALGADFKRIFTVMSTEDRRKVSFYVSSLLGLRGSLVVADSVEMLSARRDQNAEKIQRLEERLAELRQAHAGSRIDIGHGAS